MTYEHGSNRFELSQETLADAWQDLGEALILQGDTPTPIGEFSPENGQKPYAFRKEIPSTVVRSKLLSESDDIALPGRAEYMMRHRIDPEDTETFETVTVAWKSQLPQTDTYIHHGILIERIADQGKQHFNSYTSREYATQLDESGHERRISPHGIDFNAIDMSTRQGFDEAVMQSFDDFEVGHNDLTLDDAEKVHAIARYVRGEDTSR